MRKRIILTAVGALMFFANNNLAQPLAFYKGCLVTSITRGPSKAIYTTKSDDKKHSHSEVLAGSIDPLIMEYGITNKMGVGFSYGGENYQVNTNSFYNAKLPEGSEMMNASTKYFTLDFSYHPFVSKKMDVSFFGAVGHFKVRGAAYQYDPNGKFTGEDLFSYCGKGAVARGGLRMRLYITKRFGIMGMVYAFTGMVNEKAKTPVISDGGAPARYATNLTGAGMEFGFCYRLIKQKGLQQKAPGQNEVTDTDKVTEDEPLIRLVWD